LGNVPLERTLFDNLQRLGPPEFDAADRAFAEEIRKTVTDNDIDSAHRRFGIPVTDAPLCDRIVPLEAKGGGMVGSTDVGDVSWAVPTVQMRGATYAVGTPGHSWQLTAQGKTPAAHKGMVHVAKAMAATALDCLSDPALLEGARADFVQRTKTFAYKSPLPADTKAPLMAQAAE